MVTFTPDYAISAEDQHFLETGLFPWQIDMATAADNMAGMFDHGATCMAETVDGFAAAMAEKPAADSQFPKSPANMAEEHGQMKQMMNQMAGDCPPGSEEMCDPEAGKVSDQVMDTLMHTFDNTGSGAMTIDLKDVDCQMYDQPSYVGLIEDDENNGLIDAATNQPEAFQQMDWVQSCEVFKKHQDHEREFTGMFKTCADKHAKGQATARLRRRALRRLSKTGKDVHPHIRRLLKLPQDVHDSEGRMLTGIKVDTSKKNARILLVGTNEHGKTQHRKLWDESMASGYGSDWMPHDEAELECYDALTNQPESCFDAMIAATIDTMDITDAKDLMTAVADFDHETQDLLYEYVGTYDDSYMEESYALAMQPEDKIKDKLNNCLTDAQKEPYVDLMGSMFGDDPVCKGVVTPQDSTYTAGADGDSDGYTDDDEFAHCVSMARESGHGEIFDDFMHHVADGSMPAHAAVEHANPVAADEDLMNQWYDAVKTIPHDCIEQCACNAVDAGDSKTCVSTYAAGTCGQTVQNPEDSTDNIPYCDVLLSPYSGLVEEVIKAEQNIYSQTRRLQVEERRLKIKERRRLQEENNAACKVIDGKTFCPEGKEPSLFNVNDPAERRLQDHVDELEANGISYLIPSFVPKASPHKEKIIRSARSVRANAKKNRKARKLRVKQRANLKRRLTGRKGRGRK